MDRNRLALFYFKPKSFEYYENKTIYDLIGIKVFKRYLPTTGDIVRKRLKITQINFNKGDILNELYRYEKKTKKYELRHIIGFITFIILAMLIERKFTAFDWIFLPILNLPNNIYPIFLQRYNRIGIIKVINGKGYPSPYQNLP